VGATIRSGTVVEAEAPLTPTLEAVRVKVMLVKLLAIVSGCASAEISRAVPVKVTPLIDGLTSAVRFVNPAVLLRVTVLAVPAV
jgi:hypothetical protein